MWPRAAISILYRLHGRELPTLVPRRPENKKITVVHYQKFKNTMIEEIAIHDYLTKHMADRNTSNTTYSVTKCYVGKYSRMTASFNSISRDFIFADRRNLQYFVDRGVKCRHQEHVGIIMYHIADLSVFKKCAILIFLDFKLSAKIYTLH